MDFLPYTDLPLSHPARAYKSADQTDVAATIAEYREQHAPILVCLVHGIQDDYELTDSLDYLSNGSFK